MPRTTQVLTKKSVLNPKRAQIFPSGLEGKHSHISKKMNEEKNWQDNTEFNQSVCFPDGGDKESVNKGASIVGLISLFLDIVFR